MSDVPLGVFLSGGLDSSALAAIVAKMAAPPLRTFAVGFADREANELGYARQVADWIGSEHRDVVVTPDQFFAALPTLIWHEDEPIAFPSSVPLYFLSRLAAEHVKVVLTGEGRRRAVPRLQPLPRHALERAAWPAYWAVTPAAVRAADARPGSPTAGAARPRAEAHVPRRSTPGSAVSISKISRCSPERQQHELLQQPEMIGDLHARVARPARRRRRRPARPHGPLRSRRPICTSC